MENKNVIKLIKDTLMFNTDSESFEETIKWFEDRRHKPNKCKTPELFDDLVVSQVAILFKVLIDAKEVELVDNVIRAKQNPSESTDDLIKKEIDKDYD